MDICLCFFLLKESYLSLGTAFQLDVQFLQIIRVNNLWKCCLKKKKKETTLGSINLLSLDSMVIEYCLPVGIALGGGMRG